MIKIDVETIKNVRGWIQNNSDPTKTIQSIHFMSHDKSIKIAADFDNVDDFIGALKLFKAISVKEMRENTGKQFADIPLAEFLEEFEPCQKK